MEKPNLWFPVPAAGNQAMAAIAISDSSPFTAVMRRESGASGNPVPAPKTDAVPNRSPVLLDRPVEPGDTAVE
jgi:hypothetical protein